MIDTLEPSLSELLGHKGVSKKVHTLSYYIFFMYHYSRGFVYEVFNIVNYHY